MKRFICLIVQGTLILFAALLFQGCTTESSGEASYHGIVHDSSTNLPFGHIDVIVTDGDNVHTQTKTNADGEFTLTIKIKEINNQYYILIGDNTCEKKKINIPGFAEGVTEIGIILINGPQLPRVETNSVFSVDINRLKCSGRVIDGGRLEVTDRGICYSKMTSPTVNDFKVSEGKGEGDFSCDIKDLALGTTFYFRAYATNAKGTAYGEQYSFSTGSGSIEVKTQSISSITANSAKCAGSIVNDGGFSVTTLGICWAKAPDPTINDFIAYGSATQKDFECTLSNLTVSTTYHVRAFATNTNGTYYGEDLSFQTLSGLPSVSTNQPNRTATTITISGEVKDDGGFPITERGICYSTSSSEPLTSDYKKVSGNGTGSFTITITGLSPQTKYYLRAYAINQNGTSYGESRSVTTTSGLPSVTTQQSYDSGIDYLVISGTSSSENGAPITRQGVCWSTTTNPSINDGLVEANNTTSSFSCRIDGLQSGTTYYCRAFAENSYGLAYGTSYSFKTKYPSTILNGHVYDTNGKPIVGAEVWGYDISSNYSGTTDNNGYYTIDLGSMSGKCSFVCGATGYSQKIQQVTLTRGQVSQMDFYLSKE